jgi:NAD(P)H dehydrogenase (quinone)
MKIFIVYAHPEPQSFNGALKNLAVEVLTGAGHEVQVSDLYAMQFNPAGGPGDFVELEDPAFFRYQREQIRATGAGLFDPELKGEMDKLAWADFVIFQFPLWWFSLPGILKGWVDRVFAMGFSYNVGQSYEKGIFRGKRAMLSFTTGGPASTYGPAGKNGSLDELLRHVQYGMLHFIGMDVLPPFIAYSAARVPGEQRNAYSAEYRERLLALESTEPIDFEKTSATAG